MSSDQGKRLQKMIDTLMLSYNENQDIEHIGEINIPAKESIINLTEDIQVLPKALRKFGGAVEWLFFD